MGRLVAEQNQVAMLAESGTYASSSGNGLWIGQVQEHSADETFERNIVRYQASATRNMSTFVDTKVDLAGTLTYYPQNLRLLGYALGSCVDAGAAGSYTHTISEVNNASMNNAFTSGTANPFMSFTLEDGHQFNPTGLNFIRTYAGCMVDGFTITAAAGDILSCETSYIAQSVAFTSGAVTALTAATDRPYITSDTSVAIPSGTKYDNVTEWSFSINNNFDARHYANGSKEVGVPIPGNREYEVSLTLDSDVGKAKILYDQYYKGGSSFNMVLGADIAAGAVKHTGITLSGCEITSMDTPSPLEGMNEHTVTITATTASAVITDAIEKYNPW